ncbi:pyridoxal phosphate-dependent aminotransferase [Bradyrhizobium sp.]
MIKARPGIRVVARWSNPLLRTASGLCLDRNERVTDFDDQTLDTIRGLLTGPLLRRYPSLGSAYLALSALTHHLVEELLFTAGADGAIQAVFSSFISAGDRVVFPSPTYIMYEIYSRVYRAEAEPLHLQTDSPITVDEVLASITPGTRALFFPNPNQPIEYILSESALDQIAYHCHSLGCLFIVDEAYYNFSNVTASTLIRRYGNVIVIRSLSKAFGLAGLRVGYVIARKSLIDILRSMKAPYELNGVTAAIVEQILKHQDIMLDYVRTVADSRQYLRRALGPVASEINGDYTNAVLVRMTPRIDTAALTAYLATRNIFVKHHDDAPIVGRLRITLGPLREMERLCNEITAYCQANLREHLS